MKSYDQNKRPVVTWSAVCLGCCIPYDEGLMTRNKNAQINFFFSSTWHGSGRVHSLSRGLAWPVCIRQESGRETFVLAQECINHETLYTTDFELLQPHRRTIIIEILAYFSTFIDFAARLQ